MRRPQDSDLIDRIRVSFTVAPDAGEDRRSRIRETVLRRSERRARIITLPRLAAVATVAVAVAALLIVLPPGMGGSPTPAMAEVAQGLKALDAPEVVHYRIAYSGRLTERGRVLRTNSRSEEYWVDRERRMARLVTGATSSNRLNEAAYGVYVTKDGVTRELQVDVNRGKRTTQRQQTRSGRCWEDDFDGTIYSLRLWLDGTTSPTVGLRVEIVGADVFREERVVLVRLTSDNSIGATQGYRSTETQTFWLRQDDYVPVRIESVAVDRSDNGEVVSEYREVRTFSDYERLRRSEIEPDLFELEE